VKSEQELHDEKVRAYWALFLLQNANPKPDLDGSFYLGEVGSAPEKNWQRLTPYSLAESEKS
jgi:hypothetical protein